MFIRWCMQHFITFKACAHLNSSCLHYWLTFVVLGCFQAVFAGDDGVFRCLQERH